MEFHAKRPTVVDLERLPRPVALREVYGYGSPHRPTSVEAADGLLLALVLSRRSCSDWPSYLLPKRP